ncbi:MAG TPA: outer membrane lipoprotein carrier protein LolA, partial [Candidatus Limnocylindrales bacterium]|nr:outer membrane lipoprotein carrier protein LolA [Candidatus Limnocylindrales bacterium]
MRRKSKKIRQIVWALLLASSILSTNSESTQAAESNSAEPIVDALQKTYDATVDFVADFRQETEVKTLGRSLKASGKVSYKRPGKMFWNY